MLKQSRRKEQECFSKLRHNNGKHFDFSLPMYNIFYIVWWGAQGGRKRKEGKSIFVLLVFVCFFIIFASNFHKTFQWKFNIINKFHLPACFYFVSFSLEKKFSFTSFPHIFMLRWCIFIMKWWIMFERETNCGIFFNNFFMFDVKNFIFLLF